MASEQEKDSAQKDMKRQRSARKNGGARRWTAAHDELQALRDLIESFAPQMRVWAKLESGLWWPGYVPNVEDLPKTIFKHKRVGWTCVRLYGSSNALTCPEFVWLQAKSILEFGKNLDELKQQAITDSGIVGSFKAALAEALADISRPSTVDTKTNIKLIAKFKRVAKKKLAKKLALIPCLNFSPSFPETICELSSREVRSLQEDVKDTAKTMQDRKSLPSRKRKRHERRSGKQEIDGVVNGKAGNDNDYVVESPQKFKAAKTSGSMSQSRKSQIRHHVCQKLRKHSGKKTGDDGSYFECVICDTGGNLLCCDLCPRVYHLGCLSPPLKRTPPGKWHCPVCREADETSGHVDNRLPDLKSPGTLRSTDDCRKASSSKRSGHENRHRKCENEEAQELRDSTLKKLRKRSREENAESSEKKTRIKPEEDAAVDKDIPKCLNCQAAELSSSISSKLSSCKECARENSHPDVSLEVSNKHTFPEKEEKEPSLCEICGETGALIPCEHCLRLFHSTCVTPSTRKNSKGSWACPTCLLQGGRHNDELQQPVFPVKCPEVERILGCRVRVASRSLPSSSKDIENIRGQISNDEQETPLPVLDVSCSSEDKLVHDVKFSCSPSGNMIINDAHEHEGIGTAVLRVSSEENVSLPVKETINLISSLRQPSEDENVSLPGLTASVNVTEGDFRVPRLQKNSATGIDTGLVGHDKEGTHVKSLPDVGMQREISLIGLSDTVPGHENMGSSSKPVIESGRSSVDCSFPVGTAEDVKKIPGEPTAAGEESIVHQGSAGSLDQLTFQVTQSDTIICSNTAKTLVEAYDAQQPEGTGSEISVIKESSRPSKSEEPTSELEYLVKWAGRAHIHNEWIGESKLRSLAKRKLDNFKAKYGTVPINLLDQKWCEPQRVIARRKDILKGEEVLVKWCGLAYDECTWENLSESVISKNPMLLTAYTRFEEAAQKLETSISTGLVGGDLTVDKSTIVEVSTIIEQPKELTGGSLFPHQIEALNWLRKCWHRRKNVILADEMGLGKTISACAFVSSLYNEFKAKAPCLVLVPLSTMPNWLAEISVWAPDLNVIEYHGSSKARAIIRQFEWYAANELNSKKRHACKFNVILTTYEMVIADPGPLRSVQWEALIVDEGHRLKNSGSKLFHLLNTFSFAHRVLLTGTPLQNNLGELYNLLNFLQPDTFPSLAAFQDKFSSLSTAEQVDEIRKLVAPHMLRRLKKDAMQEIPPKTERVVPVELTAVQAEYYRALLTRNFQLLRRGVKGGQQQSMLNIIMELRKVCNHPYLIPGTEPEFGTGEFLQEMRIKASGKLTLLHSMLVSLNEQGHRVLIFSQMTKLLDILEDYLTFQFGHKSYERVDGSVPVSERQAAIARFNKDPSRFVFLLSTRACGLGINLATADTVIIYDSDFNPHADIQAMNRAHRIGQSKKLLVYRLVVRASVEERILQLAKKKLMLDHLFASKSGSQKEIEDILQWGTEELFHESSGSLQEPNSGGQNPSNPHTIEPADEIETAKRRRVGGLGDVYNDKCHEAGRPKVIWDDAAVGRLLDRSIISAGNDEGAEGENDNDMLGSLKAWDWNDQETNEQEALDPAGMDTKSFLTGDQKNGGEEDNKWEKLLRTRWEKFQREEEEALGRGKRQRKVVSYNESLGKGTQEVSSESEEPLEEPEPEYTPAGQALKQKLARLRARQKERIAQRQADSTAAEGTCSIGQLSTPMAGSGTFVDHEAQLKSLWSSFEDIKKLAGKTGTEAAGPDTKASSQCNVPFNLNIDAGKEGPRTPHSTVHVEKRKYEQFTFMDCRTISEKSPVDQRFDLHPYVSPNPSLLLSQSTNNSCHLLEPIIQVSTSKTVAPSVLPSSLTFLQDTDRSNSIGQIPVFEATSSSNATNSSGSGLKSFISGPPCNSTRTHFSSGFALQGLPAHTENTSRIFAQGESNNRSVCNTSYSIPLPQSIDLSPHLPLLQSRHEEKRRKSTGDIQLSADSTGIPSFLLNLQKDNEPHLPKNVECSTSFTGISTIMPSEEFTQVERSVGQVECSLSKETGTQDGSLDNQEVITTSFLPATSSTARGIEAPFSYRKLPPLTMSLGLGGLPLASQGIHIGIPGLSPCSDGVIGRTMTAQMTPATISLGFPTMPVTTLGFSPRNINLSSLSKDILGKAPCGSLNFEHDAVDIRAQSSWMQQLPTILPNSSFSLGSSNAHIWGLLDSKKVLPLADKPQASDQLPWSEEELDALWSGVRRHGRGNWLSMLQDPRLCFSKCRAVKDLSERWKEEQQKLFSGPEPLSSAQIAPESTSLSNSNLSGRMPIPLFGGAFTDKNDLQGTFGKTEGIHGPSRFSYLKADADMNFLLKGSYNKESNSNNVREPLLYSSLHLDRAETQDRIFDPWHMSSLTSNPVLQFPLSDKGERMPILSTSAGCDNILGSAFKQANKFVTSNSHTKKGKKTEAGSASRTFMPSSSYLPFGDVERSRSHMTLSGEAASGNGRTYDHFADIWKNSDPKLKFGRKKTSLPVWGTSEVTNHLKNSPPSFGKPLPHFTDPYTAISNLPPLFPDFSLNFKKSFQNDNDTKKKAKSSVSLSSSWNWPSFNIDSMLNTGKQKLQISSFSDRNVLASSATNSSSASSATLKSSSSSNLPHWLKEAFSLAPPPAPALSPQVAAVAQAVAMLHRGQKSLLPPWLHPWHPLVPPKELPKRKKKKRNRKFHGTPAVAELECSEELSGGGSNNFTKTQSKTHRGTDLTFELRNVKPSREFTLPSIPNLPHVHKPVSSLPKTAESILFSNQPESAISRMPPGVTLKDGKGSTLGFNPSDLSFLPPLHARLPSQLHKAKYLPDFQVSTDGKFIDPRSRGEWDGRLQTGTIASIPPVHVDTRQMNLFGGQCKVIEKPCEQGKSTKSELPQWLLSAASGSLGQEGNCITLTSDQVPVGDASSETHSDPDIRSKCSGDEVCQEVSSDETISDHE